MTEQQKFEVVKWAARAVAVAVLLAWVSTGIVATVELWREVGWASGTFGGAFVGLTGLMGLNVVLGFFGDE